MGAAASLPEQLDKATAKDLAGKHFDEEQFDAVAQDGLISRKDFLDAAAKVLQEDLQASRMLAEGSAKLCAHSGCAFLCTGLAPRHCCKMCAKSPGAHGPKCKQRLLPCSRPGCNYAVTGLASIHCCKMCAKNGEHGPHCWCLPVPCEDLDLDEERAVLQEEASEAEAVEAMASSSLASASAIVAARAKEAEAMALSALPDISEGEVESALIETVEKNQAAIDANAAVIEALRKALQESNAQ